MGLGTGLGKGSGRASKGRTIIAIVVIVVVIVLIIAFALIGVSFKGLNYYEYGFVRTVASGIVNTDKVYSGGLYAIGPNEEFKIFQADAHLVNLSDLAVGTLSGNSIGMTVFFQYILKKDELSILHNKYDLQYDDVIKASATEAIKQNTVRFENIEFLRNRDMVEKELLWGVKDRIHSKCCPKDCAEVSEPNENYFCEANCIPFNNCTTQDMGLNIHVYGLQLGEIDLPQDLRGRYLNALLLKAKTEKTALEKNATIIEKETEVQVNSIANEAKEINVNATSQADLIRARAAADAKAIVEDAKLNGITMLFKALNITDPASMTSINYLRNLQKMTNADFSVNFQYLVKSP